MSNDYDYGFKSESQSPRDAAVAAAHQVGARRRREETRKISPSQQRSQQGGAAAAPVLSRHSSLEQYERLQTLGKGSFGRVDKVRDRADGATYALKTIAYQYGEDEERRTALEEAKLLKRLVHPSIVRFHDAFETANHEKMCIVMELCQGTLVQAQEHAKQQDSHFTERRILSWLFQIGLALEYLHNQKLRTLFLLVYSSSFLRSAFIFSIFCS